MRVLRKGMTGTDVSLWQTFLIGGGAWMYHDGEFGDLTVKATKLFQRQNNLTDDGIVGNRTYGIAFTLGFPGELEDDTGEIVPAESDIRWATDEDYKRMFGEFGFNRLGGGKIEILGPWESDNIINVHIPQLDGIPMWDGIVSRGTLRCHKLLSGQYIGAFNELESLDLIRHITNYGGSFNPRTIRGGTRLSRHCYGAIDLNTLENPLGALPATGRGDIRPLIPTFEKWGFFSGMNFKGRIDPMHVEPRELM